MREVSYSNVPPMMAAIQSGDMEALRSLLHAGHSPNEPQCYQVTIGAWPREEETSPLELAVLENRMDMVQLLIESGADLTHNPEALLYGSLRGPDLSLFSFLIHAGARIPAKQEEICRLFLHLENRRDPDVLPILDRLGMDLKQYGGEALRSMASHGNQMLAGYLIQKGADINYHKPDMVFPYASTPVTGPLRLEFPERELVKWAELYPYMDVQEMTWKRKKLLSLMAKMDNYSDYLLLWSPRDKKLWYLDIEHKEFHPLAKWEEFIADPGKYLNGMIEGEFEE